MTWDGPPGYRSSEPTELNCTSGMYGDSPQVGTDELGSGFGVNAVLYSLNPGFMFEHVTSPPGAPPTSPLPPAVEAKRLPGSASDPMTTSLGVSVDIWIFTPPFTAF